LVIVDKLTKWGYFIAYIEEILVEDMARIYIKEVFNVVYGQVAIAGKWLISKPYQNLENPYFNILTTT